MSVGIIDTLAELLNECASFPTTMAESKKPDSPVILKGTLLKIAMSERIDLAKNIISKHSENILAEIRECRTINAKMNPAIARLYGALTKLLSLSGFDEIGNWESLLILCRKLCEQIEFYYPLDNNSHVQTMEMVIGLGNRLRAYAFDNRQEPSPTSTGESLLLFECINDDWATIISLVQERADKGLPITPEILSLYNAARECASLDCGKPTPGLPPSPQAMFADKVGALAQSIAARYTDLSDAGGNRLKGGETEPLNCNGGYHIQAAVNGRNTGNYGPNTTADILNLADDLNHVADVCENITNYSVSYEINTAVPALPNRINHLLSSTFLVVKEFGGAPTEIKQLLDSLARITAAKPGCPIDGWESLTKAASLAIESINERIAKETTAAKGEDNISIARPMPTATNTASERPRPEWLPEWFPVDEYYKRVDDGWIKDGNKWSSLLIKLTMWLSELDEIRKGDTPQWHKIDGVFQYKGRDGKYKAATADDLKKSFYYLNQSCKVH